MFAQDVCHCCLHVMHLSFQSLPSDVMPQGQVVFLGFPLSFWSEVENLSEKGDNVVASGLLGLPTGLFRGLDLRFKPSLGESVLQSADGVLASSF